MESRPFFPFSLSKMGRNNPAALTDISSVSFQAMSSSVAVGYSAISFSIQGSHSSNSLLSTWPTITGLAVAPTAPCSIAELSSAIEHESFHRSVSVVMTILCNGLLYIRSSITNGSCCLPRKYPLDGRGGLPTTRGGGPYRPAAATALLTPSMPMRA